MTYEKQKNCIICNKEYIAKNWRSEVCSHACHLIRRRDWHKKNKEHINKRVRDQYWDYYKAKKNNQSKKWYEKNKEYRKEYTKEYREENKSLFHWYKNRDRYAGNRNKVLRRDQNVCVGCGTDHKLHIHHIDGSGAERDYKKGDWKKINNSMDNLITLCVSCHPKLHAWQKRNKYICKSIQDIVRTMAKVIEESSKLPPRKR